MRDMAIVIEALGIGIALQAAIDPEHVRLGLVADVMGELLGRPAGWVAQPAVEGAPAD
jgi:hypothetical protein